MAHVSTHTLTVLGTRQLTLPDMLFMDRSQIIEDDDDYDDKDLYGIFVRNAGDFGYILI